MSSGLLSDPCSGRADDFSHELHTRHAPGVLCQGNPHLNNVLNGGDKQVWLIACDDLVLVPRERDLRFLIGGVNASVPVSPEERSFLCKRES